MSFLRGAKRLRWSETDRLLALALTIHEDMTHSGCGQPIDLATDPDLAEFWGTFPVTTCHACAALAQSHESVKEWKHPHTALHLVGLNDGWEQHLAAARAERAAADHPRDAAEQD